MGSFLSFFFLGFLALPLPSLPSSGEAFGLALLFFAGLSALELPAGVTDGVGFGFFAYMADPGFCISACTQSFGMLWLKAKRASQGERTAQQPSNGMTCMGIAV